MMAGSCSSLGRCDVRRIQERLRLSQHELLAGPDAEDFARFTRAMPTASSSASSA